MKLEQLHSDHSLEAGDFIGADEEQAYGEVLREFGRIQGGVGDGGLDFVSLDKNFLPDFQIKASWRQAEKFLARSLRFRRFIPIAVGEPGDPQEMSDSFREFGGWVGKDEPLRAEYLRKIKAVMNYLY